MKPKVTKVQNTPMTTFKRRFFDFGTMFAVILLSLSSATQAQTLLAGSVSGQFSVNQNGAATYALPIHVPPGIAGMQPQLSLNYNSQGGHGLAGVGWSLGGLSVITRCEPTKSQEGYVGRVNLKDSDRYCLEGQKLILVSGAYGQDGAEYRTEIDRFSKILGISRQGNGTAMFRVWTKNGQMMEYGGTTDSRVRGDPNNDGTVRQWSLNKVTDISGNAMNVVYWNSAEGSMHLPATISYGINTVVIAYETRPDTSKSYNVNQAVQELHRVLKISTQVGATPVKSYNFAYELSASTKRSRLIQIKECDGTGANCLKPLAFSYNDMSFAGVQIASAGHGDGGSGTKLVDLFGDGRPVYYTHNTSGGHFATRLKPDGTEQNWSWNGHGVGDAGWEIVDLFGDGKPVYWTHDTAGNHYASRLKANGDVQNWAWTVAAGKGGHGVGNSGVKRFADIFGDGKPVYYTSSDDNHYASRFTEDGNVQNWTWANTGMYSTMAQGRCPHTVGPNFGNPAVGLFDLFGEGRPVFWMRCGGNSYVHQAIQFNADQTVTPYYWNVTDGVDYAAIHAGGTMVDAYESGRYVHWARTGPYSAVHVLTQLNKDNTFVTKQYAGNPEGGTVEYQFADLFGDGHKVYWTQQGFTHRGVRMNKDGSVDKWTWNGHGRGEDGFRLVDVLGDNHQSYWTKNGTTHSITRFNPYYNPDGTGNSDSYQFTAGGIGDGGYDFADLYGEGRQVYWTRNAGDHYVSSFARGKFDNLKTVTGSTGLKQTITYTSINSSAASTIYTADTGADAAAFPKKDLQFPMSVVTKVDSDTGIGAGIDSTVYSYGGLKSEPTTGRGFLGFRWMYQINAGTNIGHLYTFNQNFPYIGMLKSSETRLPGAGVGGLIKRSTVTSACKNASTGLACVEPIASNPPNTRYFPYTSQSVEEAWDMNGAVLPISTTTFLYDLNPSAGGFWGDPTSIDVNTTYALAGSFNRKITANEYHPAITTGTNWILGRLKKSTVTSSANDTTVFVNKNSGITPVAPTGPAPVVTTSSTIVFRLLDDDD